MQAHHLFGFLLYFPFPLLYFLHIDRRKQAAAVWRSWLYNADLSIVSRFAGITLWAGHNMGLDISGVKNKFQSQRLTFLCHFSFVLFLFLFFFLLCPSPNAPPLHLCLGVLVFSHCLEQKWSFFYVFWSDFPNNLTPWKTKPHVSTTSVSGPWQSTSPALFLFCKSVLTPTITPQVEVIEQTCKISV